VTFLLEYKKCVAGDVSDKKRISNGFELLEIVIESHGEAMPFIEDMESQQRESEPG
jgi:hypothetical protein